MRPIHYISAALAIAAVAYTGKKPINNEVGTKSPSPLYRKLENNQLTQPLSSLTATPSRKAEQNNQKVHNKPNPGPSTNLNQHTHKNPRENWKMMLELPESLVTTRQRIAIQEYLNTKKNSAEETTAHTKLRNMFGLPPKKE